MSKSGVTGGAVRFERGLLTPFLEQLVYDSYCKMYGICNTFPCLKKCVYSFKIVLFRFLRYNNKNKNCFRCFLKIIFKETLALLSELNLRFRWSLKIIVPLKNAVKLQCQRDVLFEKKPLCRDHNHNQGSKYMFF